MHLPKILKLHQKVLNVLFVPRSLRDTAVAKEGRTNGRFPAEAGRKTAFMVTTVHRYQGPCRSKPPAHEVRRCLMGPSC
jgi:hypothetical protein